MASNCPNTWNVSYVSRFVRGPIPPFPQPGVPSHGVIRFVDRDPGR